MREIFVTQDQFAYIKECELQAMKEVGFSWDAFCINQLGCEPYGTYKITVRGK